MMLGTDKSIQHLKGLQATSRTRNIIKNIDYDTERLTFNPNDACVLPNNKLLFACDLGLVVYDEKFDLVKIIDKIDCRSK